MSWYTDKLKALRCDQNFSLSEISRKSGMNRSYINQIELGKRKPSFETVETLAKALGAKVYIQLEAPEAPTAMSPRNKKHTSIASRFYKDNRRVRASGVRGSYLPPLAREIGRMKWSPQLIFTRPNSTDSHTFYFSLCNKGN